MRKRIINWGLPIFFFLLPWQTRWIFGAETITGQPFEYGVLSLYATEVLLFIVALAMLIDKSQFRQVKRGEIFSPQLLVFIILIAAALSIFYAINPSIAAVQCMHLAFAVLAFILLLDQRISTRRVMIGFVAGLLAPALLGIYQFFIGSSGACTPLGLAARDAAVLGDAVIELGGDRVLRAYGSFSHPNVFGGYLVVGLIATVNLWRHYRSKLEKVALACAGATITVMLFLTFSRSAWIGLALGLGLGGLILLGKEASRTKRLLIPIAVIAIGAALALGVRTLLLGSNDYEERSISERIEQYLEYPDIVGSHWLFGYGIGNYTLAIYQFDTSREWWEYQPIHNVPLLIIGEIGIIGLVVIIAWVASVGYINFHRFSDESAVSAFVMGCVLLPPLFLDHYLFTSWQGLALVAFVMGIGVKYNHD